MNVPKTFRPEKKDLDRKTEELRTRKKIGYSKKMENIYILLYRGLEGITDEDRFNTLSKEVEDRAFEKIIQDTYEGKIVWEKDPRANEVTYKAKTKLLNAEGREIILPVLFYADNMRIRWAYLQIGNRKGPCRNTNLEKIRILAQEYFKIQL